jgi:hypothetical protein
MVRMLGAGQCCPGGPSSKEWCGWGPCARCWLSNFCSLVTPVLSPFRGGGLAASAAGRSSLQVCLTDVSLCFLHASQLGWRWCLSKPCHTSAGYDELVLLGPLPDVQSECLSRDYMASGALLRLCCMGWDARMPCPSQWQLSCEQIGQCNRCFTEAEGQQEFS